MIGSEGLFGPLGEGLGVDLQLRRVLDEMSHLKLRRVLTERGRAMIAMCLRRVVCKESSGRKMCWKRNRAHDFRVDALVNDVNQFNDAASEHRAPPRSDRQTFAGPGRQKVAPVQGPAAMQPTPKLMPDLSRLDPRGKSGTTPRASG